MARARTRTRPLGPSRPSSWHAYLCVLYIETKREREPKRRKINNWDNVIASLILAPSGRHETQDPTDSCPWFALKFSSKNKKASPRQDSEVEQGRLPCHVVELNLPLTCRKCTRVWRWSRHSSTAPSIWGAVRGFLLHGKAPRRRPDGSTCPCCFAAAQHCCPGPPTSCSPRSLSLAQFYFLINVNKCQQSTSSLPRSRSRGTALTNIPPTPTREVCRYCT